MNTTVTTIVVTEHQLSDETTVWTLTDVCERTALSREAVKDLVDLGVIRPLAESSRGAREWTFHDRALARLQRASRLRRELELDWAGVAVAMDLMEEIQQLRREVDTLRKQLYRS